jgi:hypothetical protein
VLDLGALEVAQAAVHGVRQAGREQRVLDHPALGVGTVQNRDFIAPGALAHQALGFLDDPLGFLEVGRGFVHAHLLSLAGVGAQVLAEALGVIRDQEVGAVEDVAVRAVVLLQLDQVLDLEIAFERLHVADVGAAEGVDALVVVAHREDGAAGRLVVPGQQLEQVVLQVVGILELVDQDVAEAHLVMLAQRMIALQQLIRAQQQFGEIDHAFALALVVVGFVQLDHAALDMVVGLDLAGAQTLVLVAVDEVHQILGRELLVVDIHRLQHALNHRQLILGIEDLESLGQRGVAVMGAQQAIAQAVESADPHATGIDRQHGRQPGQHFLGRLVGEGHRHDAGRRHLPGRDQPGNPGGQDAGLARAGAGQDQGTLGRQRHGRQLFWIQVVEEIHADIIPSDHAGGSDGLALLLIIYTVSQQLAPMFSCRHSAVCNLSTRLAGAM